MLLCVRVPDFVGGAFKLWQGHDRVKFGRILFEFVQPVGLIGGLCDSGERYQERHRNETQHFTVHAT